MSKKPNVIFFFTDQQRWDSCGVHGNPMKLTPNFDRMAQEGTHCYNGFTCQPVCLPARAVLQTGKYASNMGIVNNGQKLPDGEKTIGHWFRDAGYKTGYIGKWHICHELIVPKEERSGYDYWLGANTMESCSDDYKTILFDDDGNEVFLPGYRVDAETDAAIRFVDDNKDEPFFLFLSFLEPHFQNHRDDYPAPEGYEETYQNYWIPPDLRALGGSSAGHLPGYYGMIKRLDEALGRLRDSLRSLNLLDDTIIVFTADHGCHFKTRNGEYKRSAHDASCRIPMAFSGPGFQGGGRLPEMISLVDIPPTLLDACDIEVPDSMQGRSIVPLTRERAADWPEEVLLEVCDNPVLVRGVRTHRWLYSVRKTNDDRTTDTWEFKDEYLYDLKADPWQLVNLISDGNHRRIVDIMRERLVRRMTKAGEPVPEILDADNISKSQGNWARLVDEREYYM
jgi:arylsulfatase A-like enzyme